MAESRPSHSLERPLTPWGLLLPQRDGPPPLELREDHVKAGAGDACSLQVDLSAFGLSADAAPQVLLEVRHERFFSKVKRDRGVMRSPAFVFRVDGGAPVLRGEWVSMQHGMRIDFEGSQASYVYINANVNFFEFFDAPMKVLEEYWVGPFLGSGGFGKVYMLFHKTFNYKRMAMKIIQPTNERHVPYATREARIIMSLQHPCVIKTVSVEHWHNQHFLIMEYLAGGDLDQLVKEQHVLSEQQTKLIFFQIALAVEYLHERGICHRDLKPANILLQERSPNTLIKVTDFGLAKCANDDSSMKTFVGTKHFLAPEVVYRDKYTKAVDVWSMGVILYYCLTGELPFASWNEADTRKFVAKYHQSHWRHLSPEALVLVRRMLQVEAGDRVSVARVMEDPWLSDDALRREVLRLTGVERRCQSRKTSRGLGVLCCHRGSSARR